LLPNSRIPLLPVPQAPAPLLPKIAKIGGEPRGKFVFSDFAVILDRDQSIE
jgi:hypothetical protein